jgi:hypothetical protein
VILAWGVALVAAALALDRLALWMERRGWIYWRRRRATSGARSSALLSLHALLEPEREHLVEVQRQEAVIGEEDDSGEGPPGS